jgi:hypothetical protein
LWFEIEPAHAAFFACNFTRSPASSVSRVPVVLIAHQTDH